MARRIVELIAAAAFLAAAIYFPTTNTGRAALVALFVLMFIGLLLLRRWPTK